MPGLPDTKPSIRTKPKTNRSVVWEGKVKEVVVRDLPFPKIEAPEDVIVRITTSAICGTDLHIYRGFFGSSKVPYPLGHEAVGVVVEIGTGVDIFKVGDRVVVSGAPTDDPIATKNTTKPTLSLFGSGPDFGDLGGLQAEYARVPFADSSLIKIPNRLPDKEWLFLGDIFATAWEGLSWSGFEAGDSVAVFGAGPVGLLCAYSAFLRGASKIYVVDYVRQRLDKARSISPAVVVPIDFTAGGKKASEQILALSPGGVNRSVDCVGQECLNQRLEMQQDYVLRECVLVTAVGGGIGVPGQTISLPPSAGAPLAGEIKPEVSFSIAQFWLRELSMKAAIADIAKAAPLLFKLVEGGRARPGFIVDEGPFDLADAPGLYRRFNERGIVKVLFKGAPRPEEWEQWENAEDKDDGDDIAGGAAGARVNGDGR